MSVPEAILTPRLPKPESLEAKFKLLTSLPYDKRATRKHSLVFGFILDWYHSKYGDALASVRHIVSTIKDRDPSGKGLYSGDVHGALTDLVAWGYLHQEKGSGRRASRYVPVWDLVCSVQESPNTTDYAPSVLESPNADVRESPNATSNSVRDFMNEDPSTPTRSQDPETGIDGQECAAPTAPPLAGLSAATAGTAQDEFEQLWRAYDYKKNKREARTAFRKLAPDAELFAKILEAASNWRSSWAAQGNSSAPRFRLDKWLEREEFDCDPPTGYQPKDRRATTAAKSSNATAPAVPRVGEIVDAEVSRDMYGMKASLVFEFADGSQNAHAFYLEHHDTEVQYAGQRELSRICQVVNVASPEDTEELLFRPLKVTIKRDGSFDYDFAPPANDNRAEAA